MILFIKNLNLISVQSWTYLKTKVILNHLGLNCQNILTVAEICRERNSGASMLPPFFENCCFSAFIHLGYTFQGRNRFELGCVWRRTEYPRN